MRIIFIIVVLIFCLPRSASAGSDSATINKSQYNFQWASLGNRVTEYPADIYLASFDRGHYSKRDPDQKAKGFLIAGSICLVVGLPVLFIGLRESKTAAIYNTGPSMLTLLGGATAVTGATLGMVGGIIKFRYRNRGQH